MKQLTVTASKHLTLTVLVTTTLRHWWHFHSLLWQLTVRGDFRSRVRWGSSCALLPPCPSIRYFMTHKKKCQRPYPIYSSSLRVNNVKRLILFHWHLISGKYHSVSSKEHLSLQHRLNNIHQISSLTLTAIHMLSHLVICGWPFWSSYNGVKYEYYMGI